MQQKGRHAHTRKGSDEAYKALNSAGLGVIICENASACSNPAEYEWRYVGKQEMLVPYNCNIAQLYRAQAPAKSKLPDHAAIRWEKHQVWIVDGILRRGESNILARRRFYLDEDSWLILLGEGYDNSGTMVKSFVLLHGAPPAAGRQGRWYSI
jgi:hypothetical protein